MVWLTHVGSPPGQSFAPLKRVRMGCGFVVEVHGGGAHAYLRHMRNVSRMTGHAPTKPTTLHRELSEPASLGVAPPRPAG